MRDRRERDSDEERRKIIDAVVAASSGDDPELWATVRAAFEEYDEAGLAADHKALRDSIDRLASDLRKHSHPDLEATVEAIITLLDGPVIHELDGTSRRDADTGLRGSVRSIRKQLSDTARRFDSIETKLDQIAAKQPSFDWKRATGAFTLGGSSGAAIVYAILDLLRGGS